MQCLCGVPRASSRRRSQLTKVAEGRRNFIMCYDRIRSRSLPQSLTSVPMNANTERISPLMQTLSMYIATALHVKVPDPVCERAKLHVVDTFAAMISGSRLLPGKQAIRYVKTIGGAEQSGVIGTRIVTSCVGAALANGMFGHADETDDTHPPSLTHPGTSVVPAAMAIGETRRPDGPRRCCARSCWVTTSARACCSRSSPCRSCARAIMPGAFGQLFGAAAAAGALLDLDARQVRYLALLHGRAGRGPLYDVPRPGAHREGLCDGRHARAQRHAAALMVAQRLYRGGRRVLGRARLLLHVLAGRRRSRSARARARHGLRSDARRHQALAGRRADPGSAARAARPDAAARIRRPDEWRSSWRACRTRSSRSSTTATCRTSACSTCWR